MIFFLIFDSDFLECESVLTDANGTIVSPGFPNIYDENITCSWLIQLPIGQFIEVEFSNFSLDCRLDIYIFLTNSLLPSFTNLFIF